MSNPERNKEIVRQLLSDISNWRIDDALARIDENGTWWVAGQLPGVSGELSKAQLAQIFELMSTQLIPGGLNISLTGMIAEGNCVAVEGYSDAVLPNGGRYQNDYHWMFQLAEGKVIRAREYLDTLLMKQVSEGMS